MRKRLLGLLLLAACGDADTKDSGATGLGADGDGDGWTSAEDCDDGDATVSPDSTEIAYDGVDNDCDPTSPDDDVDADGSLVVDDCDDNDAAVGPDAEEVCDGLDNNCDGATDEGLEGTAYADADGDGFGAGEAVAFCGTPEPGYVADAGDCDDADALVSPAATEICDTRDNDCDGEVNEGDLDLITYAPDADADGYGDPEGVLIEACSPPDGYAAEATDCDDADPTVNPAAEERCDGSDTNCDGDPTAGAVDATVYYADADGDTWGDAASALASCEPVPGYVLDSADCDDADPAVQPDAEEVCNGGLDDNCDGIADDSTASGTSTWYLDADIDGYGDDAVVATACDAPTGYLAAGGDCDDGERAISPGAAEVCDGGVDNNCNGLADTDDATNIDVIVWYADADGDTYGDDTTAYVSCEALSVGDVGTGGDCEDGDATVNPGVLWYADGDGDGYGDAFDAVSACLTPDGYVLDNLDCDDADPAVSPSAEELCNLVDDNCDGVVDEDTAADALLGFLDADVDGYGDPSASLTQCVLPVGYVELGGDCLDGDSLVYPGADEYCNGYDDDCAGDIDEADSLDVSSWYPDGDGDTFGDDLLVERTCDAALGFVGVGGDCDDTTAGTFPGAAEVDDRTTGLPVDDDCDGWADEDFIGAGALVINEIARQTEFGLGVVDVAGQWFELFNPSTTDTLDLSNWYIEVEDAARAEGFHIEVGALLIGPGGYATICASNDYTFDESGSGLTCDAYWFLQSDSDPTGAGVYYNNAFSLVVAEDNLQVYLDATLIDAVQWYNGSGGAAWEGDSQKSIELVPAAYVDSGGPSVLNDDASYWAEAKSSGTVWFGDDTPSATDDEKGTPGAVNGAR